MDPGADENRPWLNLHDPEVERIFDEVCNTLLGNVSHFDQDVVLAMKARMWDSFYLKVYGVRDARLNPYHPDSLPKATVMGMVLAFNELRERCGARRKSQKHPWHAGGVDPIP